MNILCFQFATSIFCACLLLDSCLCATLKVCPAGWFTTATSRLCLKLIHTPENWTDARIKCQAENADLVIKIDQEKQNFMFANSSRLLVWIGLNDRRQEGTFNWLDDTQKATNLTWAPSQPSHGPDADCVAMVRFRAGPFLFDRLCNKTYKFVCEKSPDYCTGNRYGANCSEVCNSKCGGQANECDGYSGACLSGCDDGFRGDRCDLACANNTFGANCSEACSETCAGRNNECSHVTGYCIFGCDEGYQGYNCEFRHKKNIIYILIELFAAATFVLAIVACAVMSLGLKYSIDDLFGEIVIEPEEKTLCSALKQDKSSDIGPARSVSFERQAIFPTRSASSDKHSKTSAPSVKSAKSAESDKSAKSVKSIKKSDVAASVTGGKERQN
ncbi:hypothetical protein RRG08_051697 [Elysia crispata]|uniref:C-type lectin domain-containing protein n=1 Tax=Elysia crispata TaxID=231223 RepID=A0AAE1AG64_9GAST|nr:hypothetical protein RRG08_051697 [Elysia crispata]